MSECNHSHGVATSSVYQSLDELEFEKGIWSAALNGDLHRVEKLLRKISDVDQLDAAGYTALHYAARKGHLPVVRTLVANGANVNAKTRAGGATPLHRAAAAGHVDVVGFLMSEKASVKDLDGDGQTALHRAALGGHTQVLNTLITDSADLSVKDVRGRTVFDCAINHPDTRDFLNSFAS